MRTPATPIACERQHPATMPVVQGWHATAPTCFAEGTKRNDIPSQGVHAG